MHIKAWKRGIMCLEYKSGGEVSKERGEVNSQERRLRVVMRRLSYEDSRTSKVSF